MSFTCPVESNIAPNQLTSTYSGENALLPSSILPTDRDGNGMLKSSMMSDWILRLEGMGVIPSAKSLTASVYVSKITKLLDVAQKEYCFYESRYRASLQYLFTSIRNASVNNSAEAKQTIDIRLQMTQTLNRRVNDLIQIINAITEKMMKSSDTLQKEIEDFNKNLRLQRDKLEEQNKIIQSNEAKMHLQKEMVKYSEEKARYTDNLLKMYSFLNIVAFGLLIYIYKAAGDE
jgi:hypothetical protein